MFTVVYPQWLIDELRNIKSKPRLAARIHPDDLQRLIHLIEEGGFLVDLEKVAAISRDQKDDPFLACAQAGDCDFIVTGDDDLLCLKTHGRTKVISAAEFLQILGQPPQSSSMSAINFVWTMS
ncbi:MAG: putative toxin-antitoxin system toxin component, PIN family [Cyanobacteria bacterium SZAS TMP-1]|nr:putative toxin-antitoxin system toxin component, PIN family [Cyanobacteria bacterium SZAS TMP-1]